MLNQKVLILCVTHEFGSHSNLSEKYFVFQAIAENAFYDDKTLYVTTEQSIIVIPATQI